VRVTSSSSQPPPRTSESLPSSFRCPVRQRLKPNRGTASEYAHQLRVCLFQQNRPVADVSGRLTQVRLSGFSGTVRFLIVGNLSVQKAILPVSLLRATVLLADDAFCEQFSRRLAAGSPQHRKEA
jgi:hypothetical protein